MYKDLRRNSTIADPAKTLKYYDYHENFYPSNLPIFWMVHPGKGTKNTPIKNNCTTQNQRLAFSTNNSLYDCLRLESK